MISEHVDLHVYSCAGPFWVMPAGDGGDDVVAVITTADDQQDWALTREEALTLIKDLSVAVRRADLEDTPA
jgi:hypothetical protein